MHVLWHASDSQLAFCILKVEHEKPQSCHLKKNTPGLYCLNLLFGEIADYVAFLTCCLTKHSKDLGHF